MPEDYIGDTKILVCFVFTEVGVSVLKQLALTKSIHIPTLNALVPYLECSDNQEYLVKRIKGTIYSSFVAGQGGVQNTSKILHCYLTYV
jgi:purine nucleoside permease